jgi:hypothetical protein
MEQLAGAGAGAGAAGLPTADFNCAKSKSFVLATVFWNGNFAGFLKRLRKGQVPPERLF